MANVLVDAPHATLSMDRETLAIRAPAESAEYFIGMMFFEWYLKQFYLGDEPPTEEAMQARAESVINEFISTRRI
jgi:hypothetical protein